MAQEGGPVHSGGCSIHRVIAVGGGWVSRPRHPFGPLCRDASQPNYGIATVYPVTVQFMVAEPLLKSVAHCNGLNELGST